VNSILWHLEPLDFRIGIDWSSMALSRMGAKLRFLPDAMGHVIFLISKVLTEV
jgi:hypothetical protein